MTRVQLSLLAPGGVRIAAVPRIASPEARVQFPYSAPRLRRCSQDSKASACKADHAGVQFSPPPPKFRAGVAQWEERGPRKSVIGVRIGVPGKPGVGLLG